MEKLLKNRDVRAWIFAVSVLALLGWATYTVISTVRQAVQNTQQAIGQAVGQAEQAAQQAERVVKPVSDLSSGVATQIAQAFRPTPTVIVDPVSIVRQVRSLARLETIQYTVEKVITAESGQGSLGVLFGDRLLFVAHGVVIAGVDLQKLLPEDLRVENNVLYVQLPEAEIFIATLDNEKSYVYDRETGVLTKGDINLESTARRVAEQAIEQSALEDGILELARQNAESYLSRLFLQLGNYDEVVFEYPKKER
jgi:hypothetical protein